MKRVVLFRFGCIKSSLLQPWGLSVFLLPYRFALDEMPCVALCVGAPWRNQNQHDNHQYFNSPTALGPISGSSRRHQPAIPEVASTQTCGSPCWAWLLSWLIGTSGVFKDHFSWLRLVAAHFISQWGVIVFPMLSYVLSFCHGWDRHWPTRSWIKSWKYFLYCLCCVRCSSNSQSSTAFRWGTGCNRPITFWRPLSFARS